VLRATYSGQDHDELLPLFMPSSHEVRTATVHIPAASGQHQQWRASDAGVVALRARGNAAGRRATDAKSRQRDRQLAARVEANAIVRARFDFLGTHGHAAASRTVCPAT
jgi:hypothetical protein